MIMLSSKIVNGLKPLTNFEKNIPSEMCDIVLSTSLNLIYSRSNLIH